MEPSEIEKRRLALEDCVNIDENGVEFWYARDLQQMLGYTEWRNFEVAIKRAMLAAETSKAPDESHFVEVNKMIAIGKGAQRKVRDYKLTRYACYLIAMNGDPRKDEIAFAQSYFALKTRRQELIEQRMEELQRLQARETLSKSEKQLSAIAYERGVDSRGFGIIRSRGDQALFGGHDTRAMKKRLGVPDKKPLADALPSVTLAAKNLANTMTSHNVKEKDLYGAASIGNEHVDNNKSVRETLTSRGIYPEKLPPAEDAKKLARRVKADERKLEKEAKGFHLDGGPETEDDV